MADRVDPYKSYNFHLEFDGITTAAFRECSGLDATIAPIQYREGDEKVFTSRKLPGQVTYSNISLKRGITDNVEFWKWAKDFIDGKGDLKARKNGSIVLMDDTGNTEKLRWNFVLAWITKWSGPAFNATSNEVALESLEIAHEGVSKA
jgi:phage tail-like protein